MASDARIGASRLTAPKSTGQVELGGGRRAKKRVLG